MVLEILAYKHHKEQVKVHDTDDRIVLEYLYVVNVLANRRAWTICKSDESGPMVMYPG